MMYGFDSSHVSTEGVQWWGAILRHYLSREAEVGVV